MATKRKSVETFTHDAAKRRDPGIDLQQVWCGKDMQDWSDLVVQAPRLVGSDVSGRLTNGRMKVNEDHALLR